LTQTGRRQLNRSILRALAVLLVALCAAAFAGASAAGETCGKKVIDDWYADGRVDGTYELHCYDDAIEDLPRDVRDYSSAKEDIERALQDRMREDAPAAPPAPDGEPGTGGPGSTGPGADPGGGDTPGETGTDTGVVGPIDETAASDSIPVPLLVLAGLALLLVAAGSVGYLVRRLQARRVPPGLL
jgi:hypothetical protein